MQKVKVMVAGVIACAIAFGSAMGGEFDLQRTEFEKYYREITGKDAPAEIVKFAIDPSNLDVHAPLATDLLAFYSASYVC